LIAWIISDGILFYIIRNPLPPPQRRGRTWDGNENFEYSFKIYKYINKRPLAPISSGLGMKILNIHSKFSVKKASFKVN